MSVGGRRHQRTADDNGAVARSAVGRETGSGVTAGHIIGVPGNLEYMGLAMGCWPPGSDGSSCLQCTVQEVHRITGIDLLTIIMVAW